MIPLAFVFAFLGQSSAAPDVARDLMAIEERLRTTWQHDCDGWGALLAPDWSVTHITGAIITKAEALQMCRTPGAPIETTNVDNLAVRAYGDAAVVKGRTTATTRGPNTQTVTLRFTDFFVKRDGRWLVVASHATRLP